ncbi:quinone oxidoreductase family protein [Polaromonas sp. JS666]|uniref:quinone oxidoreductase family protein n=1 Tax=Polaromonas sp. (strain JS666 / ATCC BAA-500) TaxID=296591 RepID=UPI0000531478|nr:zinc-binding alcohol dehydrogenase family protein [Polaromonas sp. JS666]ABE42324.1 Alcohol dehydrogenase, zinc-binding protein [Polaromonas sp. JS666]
MHAIRVHEKAPNIDALSFALVGLEQPSAPAGQCVVKVLSAGVNPSDVKAALGAMPHAVWPRIPGRDYAGIVVDGPKGLLGKEVWGSGGELGIRRDGTHATYLLVDIDSVREKPKSVSILEAGAVGVPFITAYEGLRRAGLPTKEDVVLVFGGNGKVGQATTQLATRAGAKVFGVELRKESYRGHASADVDMIDASTQDVSEYVKEKTGGKGATIIYNTVGSPYFEQANKSLAISGRQIFISTIERAVPFDIFAFYRGQHTYVGIDTLALDSLAGAKIFDELAPGFNDGSLKPFPVESDSVFTLDKAVQGYRNVLAGARERVVVQP